MTGYKLEEIKKNVFERELLLKKDGEVVFRFFDKIRPNQIESDKNRLIPALKQWGKIPKDEKDIEVIYLDK